MSGPNVIVSGDIGSGKSTVIRATMARLGWQHPGGFFTHWGQAERGGAVLFLETWSGNIHPIARRVAQPAQPGGLPYDLDASIFNRAAMASLQPAADGHPVVIDELGLIERNAAPFAQALANLFQGPTPVLAVIQRRALEGWLAQLGAAGHAAKRVDVGIATRDALPAKVAKLFAIL
ncbi:MAG: nucleoside-triphosphatase [Kiritimatiellae bacterium]|nr:nucleoside-triphosphatase [Kiritimatiellia bacterium]MDD4341051.1 nucleoside-triphosphatase [Kiritimatiellia bacterium]MDY0149755.1 nucleoside-triphosphatase [Kiritimatiellia bacterium]